MEYRALYQEGMERLQQAGIAEASLDARLLLEYVCGTDRNDMLLRGMQEVAEEDTEYYRRLISERADHMPLQYLTNQQEFMGLSFYVDENVLIPRQDTEILVETIMKDGYDGKRILEIGTGSGCIILSLLKYGNGCQGTATDISEGALETAGKNARQLGLDVELIRTDLAADIIAAGGIATNSKGVYDIIVSNPPYIASGVISTLMPEVRDHEPVLALDGGADGLKYYRRILQETKELLAPGGKYYFEIGYDQGDAVKALLEDQGCGDVRIVKDYAGLDRVISGVIK
ncbi:MAG: peptide chain release factor N(5)-glutamine methyltransferase [Lachnospiraceae bacterium]|nr:peptide chain release factor N(5)-glutamine methyltransferase [Lachnospiraceae bacterium]